MVIRGYLEERMHSVVDFQQHVLSISDSYPLNLTNQNYIVYVCTIHESFRDFLNKNGGWMVRRQDVFSKFLHDFIVSLIINVK